MKVYQSFTVGLLGLTMMVGCSQPANNASEQNKGATQTKEVIIYSNADEEAVTAMQKVLNDAGYKDKYLFQSFGTGELGGRLMAEGKNTEADVVTMSSFYLDSAQAKNNMFKTLGFNAKPTTAVPNFYAPIIGFTGAILLNTKEMEAQKLPKPTSAKDLANPIYKNKIAMVDPKGSSTGWLFVQDIVSAYGSDKAGQDIMNAIRENAGPNLEMSGSGPIKKVLAGEVPIGFGLRHQAVTRKAEGLPIDFVDPAEGSFVLTESVAVVDKGDKTNPEAMKIAEVIATKARPELLKIYPTVIYPNETIPAANQISNAKYFSEPLTAELLDKHRAFFHNEPVK